MRPMRGPFALTHRSRRWRKLTNRAIFGGPQLNGAVLAKERAFSYPTPLCLPAESRRGAPALTATIGTAVVQTRDAREEVVPLLA
jgi:hypothetical protein